MSTTLFAVLVPGVMLVTIAVVFMIAERKHRRAIDAKRDQAARDLVQSARA